MKHLTRVVAGTVLAAAFIVPAQSATADGLCGHIVSTPGTTITLTEDLHCDGKGIIVHAPNVTINLGGHTISGEGPHVFDPANEPTSGVLVFESSNTRIVNGNIKGFLSGIHVTRSKGTFIKGITTSDTTLSGVDMDDSRDISMLDLTMTGRGHDDYYYAGGFVATNVTNVSIKDSVTSGWSGSGLNFNLVTGLNLTRVAAHDNAANGINVGFSQGTVKIDHATATRNLNGIRLAQGGPGSSVVVTNSTANGNNQHGIYFVNMPNAKMANNNANANGGDGIRVESGTDVIYTVDLNFVATINGSRANGNHGAGISLESSGSPVAKWSVVGNDSESNGGSGVALHGGQAALKENISNGNRVDGYTWSAGTVGSSALDVSRRNHRHGVFVDARASNTVTISDATATDNRSMGLMAASGTVKVTGGKYYTNRVDGVRASAGTVYADRVTSSGNGGNGVAFLRGSNGAVSHISATKNSRYGICVAPRVHVSDVPPHILYANTLGPRGSACRGIFIPPFLPLPGMH